jgi:hypothetical protein
MMTGRNIGHYLVQRDEGADVDAGHHMPLKSVDLVIYMSTFVLMAHMLVHSSHACAFIICGSLVGTFVVRGFGHFICRRGLDLMILGDGGTSKGS